MARDLLTIRCPEGIRAAIEERMATSGKGKTDVVLELLRTALGMPTTDSTAVSTTTLDERITALLDERTTALYESVTARVEEAIAPVKEHLAAMADALGEFSA